MTNQKNRCWINTTIFGNKSRAMTTASPALTAFPKAWNRFRNGQERQWRDCGKWRMCAFCNGSADDNWSKTIQFNDRDKNGCLFNDSPMKLSTNYWNQLVGAVKLNVSPSTPWMSSSNWSVCFGTSNQSKVVNWMRVLRNLFDFFSLFFFCIEKEKIWHSNRTLTWSQASRYWLEIDRRATLPGQVVDGQQRQVVRTEPFGSHWIFKSIQCRHGDITITSLPLPLVAVIVSVIELKSIEIVLTTTTECNCVRIQCEWHYSFGRRFGELNGLAFCLARIQ